MNDMTQSFTYCAMVVIPYGMVLWGILCGILHHAGPASGVDMAVRYQFHLCLARLNLRDTVVKQDVDEAIRLLDMSKASLNQTQQFTGRYVLFLNCNFNLFIKVVNKKAFD
ncbi:hypothetical protein TNCV_4349551 [Trichonephila clavipes]|nr:hypothetical protein TNCV_4349551 [Trichonephila clavipes]